MRGQSRLIKFKFWILKFIQLQLFLTLISLPILIMWGLPISIASPLGNLFFTPILSLFLLLSSLIFFLELVHLPNTFFIGCLEKLTSVWMWFFNFGTSKWLVTLPLVSNIVLILIPVAALLVLQHKKTKSLNNSIVAFCIILTSSCIFLKLANKTPTGIVTYKIDNKTITVLNVKDKIYLIDFTTLTRSFSPQVFIEYSLLPYLVRTFGHTSINSLVIKSTSRTQKILEALLERATLKKLYILNPDLRSDQYKDLKSFCKVRDIQLEPLLGNKSRELIISDIFADKF